VSTDYEVVYDLFGTAHVIWPKDHPSSVADRELLAALDRHPKWRQHGGSATAQRDSVPRVMGFEQGPWAGVCWDCGNGGQWLAFCWGNSSRQHPEWDRSFGAHPTLDEAIAAADAGLDALLAEIAQAES
jgi:hypothetical protein